MKFMCPGWRKKSAFVPIGANGVFLKLNSPSRRAYADNFGFLRDDRSRLMLISACCSSSQQSCIGKSLLTVHSLKKMIFEYLGDSFSSINPVFVWLYEL